MRSRKSQLFLGTIIAIVCTSSVLPAQSLERTILVKGVALPLYKGYAETIIAPNPIEASLALGTWKTPSAGETVTFVNGEQHAWQPILADSTGWFEDSLLERCYVSCSFEMKEKTVVILEAMGNEMVYVNGVPRSGNPYGLKEQWEAWEPNFQYSRVPVVLEQGENELLFRCQRGRLKVSFYPSPKEVMLNEKDITIPDLIVGEQTDTRGAIVVINASPDVLKALDLETRIADQKPAITTVPVIQPFSVRKIGFRIMGNAHKESGSAWISVALLARDKGTRHVLDTVSLPSRVVKRSDNRKETFTSVIDGSVQYYGIQPSSGADQQKPQALFLSLHGAGVDAINQSGSYFPKSWGYIVAPTNRRPYGFNWEEWGRADALEVLDTIKHRYTIDENRIYLTGHSMGGHGVWHLGSLVPDLFAALGPSAGWISFWTYRFRGQDAVDITDVRKMIRRSTTPSETFMHVDNYNQLGVYILHGSEDDNVFPQESRMMVEHLSTAHKDFVYHEQKGAGHWWDLSDEPGADCVDWGPMFDFFARHSRPLKERIKEIHFKTANPGIASKNNWLTINAQERQLIMSSADIHFDPGVNRFRGTTDNIAQLAFDLDIVRKSDSLTIELDGQRVVIGGMRPDLDKVWLGKRDGKWSMTAQPSFAQKGAHRYGTLKEVFRNRMIFVYGTNGTQEENQWAFNKARYDAERFWYQGNGSIDVIPDVEFEPEKEKNRNVILYGNRNTNNAWNALLPDSPVQVGNGSVRIGEKTLSGNDLCCLFVRPRAGSTTASIAAISGTGIVGMKLANRLPYMNPGIGLPDCTVMNKNVLVSGEPGIIMTGFFGLDWSLDKGEFVLQSQQ
jgi:hypothetical protein